jgi:hypothetical protein
MDASEFDAGLLKSLNRSDVLFEVYGRISVDLLADTEEVVTELCYVVVPICIQPEGNRSIGIRHVLYRSKNPSLKALQRTIQKAPEFDIFSALAYGLKALRNKQYDAAETSLQSASSHLQKALTDSTLGEWQSDPQEIVRFLKELLTLVTQKACGDSGYAGTLKQLCGGS